MTDVERFQSGLPEEWRVMVGFARAEDCRFCAGWWATASGPRDPDTRYPLIISSETGRPRGEHHDRTVAAALSALRRHLDAAGHGRPVAGSSSGTTRLTPLDRETMEIYAALGSQRAVAEKMGLSLQTVKNRTAGVYRKLGVRSATGAFTALGWLRVERS